jgi:hypothetical protein
MPQARWTPDSDLTYTDERQRDQRTNETTDSYNVRLSTTQLCGWIFCKHFQSLKGERRLTMY